MNQIAIYDKAWDAIFALPRNVQKKVPEFMLKFRTNSKSSGIHLEPISTFSDPQLRTARLDKKYRLIIHAPESGNMYHLLHVGNHDEAMDWASRKVFNWNDNTQSYQVYTSPPAAEISAPTSAEDKVASSKGLSAFSEHTDEALLAIGVPEVLLPSVKKVENEETLEALYDYLPIEALENLSMLMEGANYDDILRDIDAGKVASALRHEQEQSANNQRSFIELTSDDQLNEVLSGQVAKWRIFLHPSQRKLVDGTFKGPTKVTGGAGTGKTVAALHRARVLEQRGRASREQPILFTTYTKALSKNLQQELIALGCDPMIVRLQNIDAFVMEAAKDAGINNGRKILDFPGSKSALELWKEVTDFRPSKFSAEFLADEYRDVILHQAVGSKEAYFGVSRRGRQQRISRKDKLDIWKLIEIYEQEKQDQGYEDLYQIYNQLADLYQKMDQKPFSHVIADELQDFSNVHLRLLRSAVAEQSDDLFLVGDPLQKIYNRRIVFREAGINVRGRRSRRLKINYRTTEKIRQAAVNVIKGITFSDFDEGTESKNGYVSLRQGVTPTYEVFSTKDEEIRAVLQRLKDYLFGQHSTGLDLSPADICIATRRRSSAKDFRKALYKADIPYYDLTEGRVPTGDEENGVRLSTLHNMKGLEFKIVFLADLSDQTFPYHPASFASWSAGEKEAHYERERSLLYVAITRAIVQAHWSGVGKRFE